MLELLFGAIASVINLYSILCLIYIIMSWFPGVKFTKVGRFISTLCEPYLNLFSGIKILHIGNVDFSPIVGFAILELVGSIFARITVTGRIYVGSILASIVATVWQILSFILILFLILCFVRWIVLLVNHEMTPAGSPWYNVDQIIGRVSFKISRIFTRRHVRYIHTLLMAWIVLAVFFMGGRYLFEYLEMMCYRIPF